MDNMVYTPVPRRGYLSKVENYRSITLTCIAVMIYNTMLRNIIQPEIDTVLRPNQNGFRQSRSILGQVLTVCRIIE